jgi:predicted nuclease with TOPRIM domain
MLLKTRNDFNEIKNENTKLSTRFTEQQRNLEIYQKQIKKNEEIKQSKVELQKKKINDTENKIKEISEIDDNDLVNQLKEITSPSLMFNFLQVLPETSKTKSPSPQ